MKKLSTKTLFLALLVVIAGCSTAPPDGVQSVSPFDVNRYLGQWYEIARLDHSFERGLSEVSATYTLQPDGSLEVLNKGYDVKKDKWKSATGRALFTGPQTQGSLKVSFFGPFYGGYHVIALDQVGYQWAMIAGPDRDYLWLLARNKTIAPDVREALLKKASDLGFATQNLIWVEHKQH
jgi:apolipoprotein D and lipocalin family protein